MDSQSGKGPYGDTNEEKSVERPDNLGLVDEIFSSCSIQEESISVTALAEYLVNNFGTFADCSITKLKEYLDPSGENILISRTNLAAMIPKWISKISDVEGAVFEISQKESSDVEQLYMNYAKDMPSINSLQDEAYFSSASKQLLSAGSDRMSELEYQNKRLLQELSFVRTQLNATEEQNESLQRNLSECKDKIRHKDQVIKELDCTRSENENLRQMCDKAQCEHERMQLQLVKYRTENEQLVKEIKVLECKDGDSENDLSKINETVQKTHEELAKLEKDIAAKDKELARFLQENEELKKELETKESDIFFLRNEAERYKNEKCYLEEKIMDATLTKTVLLENKNDKSMVPIKESRSEEDLFFKLELLKSTEITNGSLQEEITQAELITNNQCDLNINLKQIINEQIDFQNAQNILSIIKQTGRCMIENDQAGYLDRIDTLVQEVRSLNVGLSVMEDKNKILNEENAQLKQELNNYNSAFSNMKQTLEILQNFRERCSHLEGVKSQLENETAHKYLTILNLQKENDELKKEQQKLINELDNNKKELISLDNAKNDILQELSIFKMENARLEILIKDEKTKAHDMKKQFQHSHKESLRLQNDILSLKDELSAKNALVMEKELQAINGHTQYTDLITKHEELREKYAILEESLHSMKAIEQNLQESLRKLKEKEDLIYRLENELKQSKEFISDLQKLKLKNDNKLKLLETVSAEKDKQISTLTKGHSQEIDSLKKQFKQNLENNDKINANLEQQVKISEEKLSRLQSKYEGSIKENANICERYETLKSELKSLVEKNLTQMHVKYQCALLTNEISNLNQKVMLAFQLKDEKIEDMEKEIKQLRENNGFLEEKVTDLEELKDGNDKEIEQLRIQLEQVLDDFENHKKKCSSRSKSSINLLQTDFISELKTLSSSNSEPKNLPISITEPKNLSSSISEHKNLSSSISEPTNPIYSIHSPNKSAHSIKSSKDSSEISSCLAENERACIETNCKYCEILKEEIAKLEEKLRFKSNSAPSSGNFNKLLLQISKLEDKVELLQADLKNKEIENVQYQNQYIFEANKIKSMKESYFELESQNFNLQSELQAFEVFLNNLIQFLVSINKLMKKGKDCFKKSYFTDVWKLNIPDLVEINESKALIPKDCHSTHLLPLVHELDKLQSQVKGVSDVLVTVSKFKNDDFNSRKMLDLKPSTPVIFEIGDVCVSKVKLFRDSSDQTDITDPVKNKKSTDSNDNSWKKLIKEVIVSKDLHSFLEALKQFICKEDLSDVELEKMIIGVIFAKTIDKESLDDKIEKAEEQCQLLEIKLTRESNRVLTVLDLLDRSDASLREKLPSLRSYLKRLLNSASEIAISAELLGALKYEKKFMASVKLLFTQAKDLSRNYDVVSQSPDCDYGFSFSIHAENLLYKKSSQSQIFSDVIQEDMLDEIDEEKLSSSEKPVKEAPSGSRIDIRYVSLTVFIVITCLLTCFYMYLITKLHWFSFEEVLSPWVTKRFPYGPPPM